VLGGRRGLITPDGTLRVPALPGPEPIEELIEVPTPTGTRLIGRGVSTLYSFADILAEPKVLAHAPARYANIDPGPGMIAAWTTASDRPTYFDVETGQETHLGPQTALPIRSVSFVDAKKGAAIFAVAGLAGTTDGGATWTPIVDPGGGAFAAKRLSPRDGLIEARIDDDGSEREVDPVASTLGDPTPHPTPGDAASAIERWLARTHRDPLEVAVSDGVATTSGHALVASQGFVARVDLATGAILELVDLGAEFAAHTCTIARGGGKAWVACAQDLRTNVTRLASFSLGDGPLEASPLQSIGTTTDLRGSESGGVLILGPCQPGGDGNACALQPDGKWRTLDVPRESTSPYDSSGYGGGYYGYGYGGSTTAAPIAYAVGALADGGVAYFTNFHDDTPPDDDAGAAPASSYGYYGYGGYKPPPPKFQLVVIEGGGMHRKYPPLDFTALKPTQIHFVGALEEDVEHTLRILLQDNDGAILVAQPQSGDATITRIDGAKSARIHGTHGIAIGPAALLTSTDSGATWSELQTPAHILPSTTGAAFYSLSPADFEASDVGFHIVGHLRIGWGDLDPSDAALNAPKPDLLPPQPPSSAARNRVVCTTTGKTDVSPISMTQADSDKLFHVTTVPSGTRRVPIRTANPMGPTTLFEIEGPERATSPTKWRIHWVSSWDTGARPFVWTGDAPKATQWYATVVGAASAGDRFFALLRGDSRMWALRVSSGGSGELVEVPVAGEYYATTVIGAHAGDPVAWFGSSMMYAMPWTGGSASAVASISAEDRAILTLGYPSKGGVPVYATGKGWGATRVFPLPTPTAKPAHMATTAAPPAFDGWVQAPPGANVVANTSACDSKSRGTDYRYAGLTVPLEVDGAREYATSGGSVLRIAPDGICVAAVSETAYAVGSVSPGSSGGPVTFLRADFVGKRAEGGGSGAKDSRTLSCKIESP
jgi:hypothetical protein